MGEEKKENVQLVRLLSRVSVGGGRAGNVGDEVEDPGGHLVAQGYAVKIGVEKAPDVEVADAESTSQGSGEQKVAGQPGKKTS